jgi:dynein heavy chain
VQVLFGLPVTEFNELDRLKSEIQYLNRLYDLYEVYVDFNQTLRDRSWHSVDLDEVANEMSDLLGKVNALPSTLHVWSAFTQMRGTLIHDAEVCC